jgi:hypothetical protein
MNGHDISREEIEFAGLQRVTYSKLPWEEQLTVIWGWCWRTIIVGIGAGTLASFCSVILLAIISRAAGNLEPRALAVVLLAVAFPLWMLTVHPLIRWLLTSRIGDYRLVLCKRRADDQITLSSDEPPQTAAL